MQIRRAEAADEEALASIRRRAILALAVPAMSREQAERWATRGAADHVARAMREHDVWVAVEGAAIGWVEVDRDRVAALYVSPSCSRRGVGSALLIFAETSIRSSRYTTARLESSQNALDYYLRRGYLRCGPADSDGAWPLRKDLAAGLPNPSVQRPGRSRCPPPAADRERWRGRFAPPPFGRLTVYPRRAVYYRSAVRMGSDEGSGEPQEARCQLSRGRCGIGRSTLDHVSRRGAL